MDRKTFGHAGLQGWRAKLADTVAPPVAKRSGLDEDDVKAAVGVIFLILTILYVVNAVRELAANR
jgi:hypothetical protein